MTCPSVPTHRDARARQRASRACARARPFESGDIADDVVDDRTRVSRRRKRTRPRRTRDDDGDAIEFDSHWIRISIDSESRAVAENANARWGAIESIRVSFARRVCARVCAFECVLSAF